MLFELALDVSGFVLVDDVLGRHPVEVRLDLTEHCLGLLGVIRGAKFLDEGPHLAAGGAVTEIATLGLADALGCRFVLWHG